MANNKSTKEQRKHPRVSGQVPLKIMNETGDVVTETANISRSGAYCKVNQYIEPMTKLKVHLLLPLKMSGKSTQKKISCEGIIVRTEAIGDDPDHYNVAIFFNDITQKDAEVVADYVSQLMEDES